LNYLNNPDAEKLYTTGEVAKIFGVSYVTVKKWAYSGKIKYIKTPGGKYSEIKRLLGEAPKGNEKTRGGS